MYFHLTKLKEAGLIKEVGQLPTGKKKIVYYGRTAKAFMPSIEKHAKCLPEGIMELIGKLNPEYDTNEIDIRIKQLSELEEIKLNEMGSWFEKNQHHFINSKADTREMVDYIMKLMSYNKSSIEFVNSVIDLLKLDFVDKI